LYTIEDETHFPERVAVPTLKIDLREGFEGDHVVARVDGRVVYDKPGVRTRMQIGLADSVEVQAGAQAELAVSLPDKGLEGTTTVMVDKTPNVGVSVEGGKVHFTFPPEGQVMFGYV
jgi:hypothetical protein